MQQGYKVIIHDLPEVSEMVYTEWMFQWTGQYQFVYDDKHIPKEVFEVTF